jgi:NAD(P)-dependent dehydrogenase (short-subunit alcohol dehydrogenase family)
MQPEDGAGVADVDLSNRTVLVTGSTSGIGRETALALGRLGAEVLVHGRSREAGAEVASKLDATAGTGAFHAADFADLDAVEGLAEWARGYDPDVLVNNAGGYFREGRLADAGVEYTFTVNHLAGFLLTERLRSDLPDNGRIVIVSSEAHRGGSLDVDSLRSIDRYSSWGAYSRSKLANVLHARELASRTPEGGPAANALHPGVVPGSGFVRHLPAPLRTLAGLAGGLAAVPFVGVESPAEAAETSVYLAAAPDETTTGAYFDDCRDRQPAAAARDDRAAEQLWEWSKETLHRNGH